MPQCDSRLIYRELYITLSICSGTRLLMIYCDVLMLWCLPSPPQYPAGQFASNMQCFIMTCSIPSYITGKINHVIYYADHDMLVSLSTIYRYAVWGLMSQGDVWTKAHHLGLDQCPGRCRVGTLIKWSYKTEGINHNLETYITVLMEEIEMEMMATSTRFTWAIVGKHLTRDPTHFNALQLTLCFKKLSSQGEIFITEMNSQ